MEIRARRSKGSGEDEVQDIGALVKAARSRAQASTRCPYCHEELEGGQNAWPCPACEAGHHLACAQELGACACCGVDARDAAEWAFFQRLAPPRQLEPFVCKSDGPQIELRWRDEASHALRRWQVVIATFVAATLLQLIFDWSSLGLIRMGLVPLATALSWFAVQRLRAVDRRLSVRSEDLLLSAKLRGRWRETSIPRAEIVRLSLMLKPAYKRIELYTAAQRFELADERFDESSLRWLSRCLSDWRLIPYALPD